MPHTNPTGVRTPMVVRTLPGIYPAASIDLTDGDAFDAVNGMAFAASGREILILSNLTGQDTRLTIPSTADRHGRLDDGFTDRPFLKQGLMVLGPWFPDGWRQDNGLIWIDITGNVNYLLLRTG